MSWQDFIDQVNANQAQYPSWRIGQAYYNTFAEIFPNVAEQIVGTGLDPYYNNSNIPAFIGFAVHFFS